MRAVSAVGAGGARRFLLLRRPIRQFLSSAHSFVVSGSALASFVKGCLSCPLGKFTNLTDAEACQSCPINTFAPVRGSVECETCPSGRQSGIGAAVCSWCTNGQCFIGANFAASPGLISTAHRYESIDDQGNKTCADCETGTYSPLGLYCLSCGQGYYSSDRITCNACEGGKFSTGEENSECSECDAGTHRLSARSPKLIRVVSWSRPRAA